MLVKKRGAGLHVKTDGTTWLEQIIGLAEAGGGGLEVAREIYRRAHPRFAELVGPYAPVVDIDPAHLPAPGEVDRWTAVFLHALDANAEVVARNVTDNLLDLHLLPIFG